MQIETQIPRVKDVWADGAAYEQYVGRWSRLLARDFLEWLAIPAARRWLDIGCGAGALSQRILETADPVRVDAIDRSSQFADFAKSRVPNELWAIAAGDAQALPVASGKFDAVVSGLMLNFVPDPRRAVEEMARVAAPGGTIATYVWDYSGDMEFMRYFWDAASELDPQDRDLDEGIRFRICRPEPLTDLFQSVGLKDVQTRAIDIPTVFRDFEDYWSPFHGGQGAAAAYLVTLSQERQLALERLLRERLPIAPDGSIRLIARAWAVRGTR